METQKTYEGTRATVMGLGLFGGGTGAAKYLAGRGALVTVTDLRGEEELAESIDELRGLEITLHLGGHSEEDFTGADLVVVNPAVKPSSEHLAAARSAGAAIVTEAGMVMELARERSCPVLGVTGTNGKSTTTAMLGRIMTYHGPTLVGGNIGGSLLDRLERCLRGTAVVMELSSFQLHRLGEAELSPNVAVVTNLSPNHLDWHGSAEEYYRCKAEILRHQSTAGAAVVNLDDDESRGRLSVGAARRYGFSLGEIAGEMPGAFLRRGYIIVRGLSPRPGEPPKAHSAGTPEILRVGGEHNVANALAAAAAASAAGAAAEEIALGLSDFDGLPDRMETVAIAGGVRYINDSVATTPISAAASIAATPGTVVLVAGGRDKGLDFGPLARAAAGKVRAAVLTGDAAERLGLALAGAAPGVEVLTAGGVAEAAAKARELARDGEAVLLSPGCSSYDEFRNYRDRAEAFKRAVGGPVAKPGGPEA